MTEKGYECCGQSFKSIKELEAHIAKEHRVLCGGCQGCCS